MAKGRVRKPSKTAPEAADSAQIAGPEQVSARPTGPSKKEARKTAQAERGLRKHIKRLEAQLADAAKAEAKKVKKLEKARWRRQLVEAFIDEAKSVASLRSRPAAAKSEATPAAAEQVAPAAPAAPAAKARTGRRAKATPAAESSVETPAAAAPAAATTVARPARASRKTAVKTAVADVAPTESPAEAALGADGAKPVEAYCLREKKRVQMLDPKPVQTANGGSALSGTCPSCGAALYKLVGRAGH